MSEVIKHTPKLWERRGETKSYFLVWCPGCGCGHCFWCGPGFDHPARWEFNGNYEKPSFSPSLRQFVLITDDDGVPVNPRQEQTVCHLHVTDGEVRYCGDNPHKLNNQTVPMQDIPADYGF